MANTYLPEDLLQSAEDMRVRRKGQQLVDDLMQRWTPPPPAPAPQEPAGFGEELKQRMLAPFQGSAASPAPADAAPTPEPAGFGEELKQRLLAPFQSQASPYSGALGTLGGTPEAEALTQPGGTAYTGDAPSGEMRYGAIDHSSRDAFVRSMAPYAVEAEKATGIPAAIMLAINLNEQGWQNPAPGNNYFGIKGSNPRTGANTGPVSTWEDYGNGRVNIQDTFRAYGSPAESYADFAQFLKDNPRYQGALQILQRTGDPAAFIKAVHQAGYATDPAWSDKILNIAQGVAPYVGQAQQTVAQPQPAASSAPMGTIKGGISVSDAMAADRGRSAQYALEPASDPANVTALGDEPLYGAAPSPMAGPSVPYGVADNVEPGDFAIPGRDLTAQTAPSPQPSDAVEPASSAPASLGDSSADPWQRVGQAIGDAVRGAISGFLPSKEGMQQASQDIRERQATFTDPGGPMPFEQVRAGAEAAVKTALPGLDPEANQRFWVDEPARAAELLQKEIDARQGRGPALTPDEQEEWYQLTSKRGQVIGANAPEMPRGLPREPGMPGYSPATAPRDTAPAMGIVGQADDAGRQYDRYYHGTGSDFALPEPGKFDPNGLFGPGYYVTSDARVAGSGDLTRAGYAEERGASAAKGGTSVVWQQWADRETDPIKKASLQEKADAARAKELVGPNIRPVDVPRDLKLLDADALPPDGIVGRIQSVLPDAERKEFDRYLTVSRPDPDLPQLWRGVINPDASMQSIYDAIPGSRARANAVLQSLGYDGIRYAGGKRIPMTDAAGKAIEHTALVIFPESLDKIRNATAGTPGGLLPGTTPQLGTATRIGGQALGSGVGAAYQESQREGSTPESIAQAGLGAAVTSLGGQALRRAVGPRGAQSILRAANEWHPKDSSDPNVRTVGEIFAKDVKAPENQLPFRVRMTQALTDDRAPFSAMEQSIQQAGHALNPEDKVSLITRVNADSVASQRLRDTVQPAILEARDAGVSPEALSQYLAHMHNVDIAKEVGDRAYDTAIARGSSPQVASAAAQKAANDRQFTGGLTLQETLNALTSMRQDMGPQRAQAMDAAAQSIWDFNRETLARKHNAGLISDALYTELEQRYPHYVTTHVVEHLAADAPSSVSAGGLGEPMRSAPVRAITMKGTSADRLDPLASVALNTVESERMIARNEAYQAFRELSAMDPSFSAMLRQGANARRGLGERTITGFVNGNRETVTLAKPLADVVEMVQAPGGPAALQTFMSVYKAALTSRNPGFALVVNPLRDFSDFIPKQAAYEGGAQQLPRVLAAYVQSIPEAFGGLLSGQFKGDAARYLAAGGGMGRLDTSPRAMQRLADDLSRRNALEIRGPGDVMRLAGDLAKFEWSQAIGDRMELVPRVAAMKLAERRGAGSLEAMIAGRDATIDFQRGGWLTRSLNTLIPFLNPTVQAGAQLGRALKDHPVGTIASGAATIGTAAILSELWNHADATRAAEYADVPQYQKDGGIIFMMPWAGSDARGDRRNYVWVPLGIMAPFAMLARTALDARDGQLDERSAQDMAIAALTQFSPVKGDSVTGAIAGLTPPVLSTAAELRANKDFYRNTPIATDQRDEQASAVSKWLAPILAQLGDSGLPLVREFAGARPSQVDYALTSDTGIYGQVVKGTSDLIGGRQREENRPIQNMPLVGNVAGRIIRDSTGETLTRAREQMISPSVRQALRDAGMRDDQLTGVRSDVKGTPLLRVEQSGAQLAFNTALNERVRDALADPDWKTMSQADREIWLRRMVESARKEAASTAAGNIPDEEWIRRREQEAQKNPR